MKTESHEVDMMIEQSMIRLRDEIENVIAAWCRQEKSENYWREPLIAAASAIDPLFEELRRLVDPGHAMPGDILSGAKAVIVFFLPFQEWLGKENDQAGFNAARSWAQSYVATNQIIRDINDHLKARLEDAGYRAAVTPATHNFDEQKLVSRWSHKHLAYIAGLGKFGCHHQLITASGCCGRLGSIITSMPLSPTPRQDDEWCLEKAGHNCSACVSKCAYDALFETRYDRHRCYEQCLINDRFFDDLPLVDVCGKCGCEVPCSYRIPRAASGK
jgi:epoxyqueuosine reductase